MPDRPLIVTDDASLLDDLLRLCAAAGVEAQVAPDAGAARAHWAGAPLVVLGDDVVSSAVCADLPRRADVVVVTRDGDGAIGWGRASEFGATLLPLPAGQAWLVERLGEASDGPGSRGVTVAVVGGRGGAGATTLAAALALTAVRSGLHTMLIDGDPLGGGIDLALGGEGRAGLRWPDLAAAGGRVSGRALRESLPRVGPAGRLTVLSCGRGNASDVNAVPAEAMHSVQAAAARAHDLVVIDIPRRINPAAEVALASAALTLLVVPAEVRATAAAARVVVAISPFTAHVRVVVRGPAPAHLSARAIAETLGLPLAGWLRPEPGLAAAFERGEPPARNGRSPLARLSRALLAELDGFAWPAA